MTLRASGNQSRDDVYGGERYRRMDMRGLTDWAGGTEWGYSDPIS